MTSTNDQTIHPTRTLRPISNVAVAALALILSLGALILSCAFALSRYSSPLATPLYVLGSLVIILAPALVLLRRRYLTPQGGLLVSLFVGAITFIVTQCYSPVQFRFQDEFQHLATANSILSTHHLFAANPTLAISPQYPGLEIVATLIALVCHVSPMAAGTVTAGAAHVLITALVYLLAREMGLSPRAGGVTVIIFATAIDYPFFLSYFVYETLAVPLLLATLIATLRVASATTPATAARWAVAASMFLFATTVTHHLTSYVLLIFLGVLSLVFGIMKLRSSLIRLALLSLFACGVVAVWDLAVATDTLHYLGQLPGLVFPSTSSSAEAVPQAAISPHVSHYLASRPPVPIDNAPAPWDLLGRASIGLILLVIPLAIVRAWRSAVTRTPQYYANMVLACGYYLLIPLFVLTPGGNELVGRGEVFVMIPVAILLGSYAESLTSPLVRHRHSRMSLLSSSTKQVIMMVGAPVILVGQLVLTWPPYEAKLPAPFQIGAYERSTDLRTIDAAYWLTGAVGSKVNIVADHRESLLFEAIGGQKSPTIVAPLFETTMLTSYDLRLIRSEHVEYIIADYRITDQIPAEGYDFDADPLSGRYSGPLPRQVLTKYNNALGVDRVFDDGSIVIYYVGNLQNAR